MTVYINGTTGYSGPVGTIGDLTTTGNTTLGDASTDKTTINGKLWSYVDGTTTQQYLSFGDGTTTYSSVGGYRDSSTTGHLEFYTLKAGTLTEGMRLDNAGNLGLGVSPSTWSQGKATEIGVVGNGIWAYSGVTRLMENVYFNSGYKYAAASIAAAYFTIDNGVFYWNTTGTTTGAQGGTAAFTQAMTLDASGNLFLGATSAGFAEKFRVYGNYSVFDNGTFTGFIGSGSSLGTGTGSDFAIRSSNAIAFLSGGATERARISSSGTLLLGTTSTYGAANNSIQLAGGANTGRKIDLYSDSTTHMGLGIDLGGGPYEMDVYFADGGGSGSLRFGKISSANPGTWSELARIDSSGNLLVGATSVPASMKGVYTYNPSSGANTNISNCGTASGTAYHWTFLMNSTEIGSIRTTSTATSYVTSSDYRLKNTIAPMTGALTTVAALKPCTYKWNADGSDGEGFIAHELAEVCPHAVVGEKDAVDEDGNPKYQGIDTSFLVATLTAAIQEQQAIIENLKARLDAANL